MSKKNITIILADDHQLFRFGIRQILEKEKNIQIIGEADSIDSAFVLTQEFSSDLILLDLNFPHKNGVFLTHEISKKLNTKILILTSCIEKSDFEDCFFAGAHGYLEKNSSPAELLQAM